MSPVVSTRRDGPLHRLGAAEFEVRFEGPEEARREGEDLEGMLREVWLPALGAVMDRLSPGRRPKRLERVELDLGSVPVSHWRDTALERLVDAFERELRVRLGGEGPDSQENGSRLARALGIYLEQGVWTLEGEAAPVSPEEVLERLLEEGAADLARLLGERPGASATQRLVREFSHGTLTRLVGLQGREGEDVADLLDLLQVTLRLGRGGLPTDVLETFWEVLLRTPSPSGGASEEWLARLLADLSARLDRDLPWLVGLLRGTLASNPIALKRMPRLERLLEAMSRTAGKGEDALPEGIEALELLGKALESLDAAQLERVLPSLRSGRDPEAARLVRRFAVQAEWVERASHLLSEAVLEDLLESLSPTAAGAFDRIRRRLEGAHADLEAMPWSRAHRVVWRALVEAGQGGRPDPVRTASRLGRALGRGQGDVRALEKVLERALKGESRPVGGGVSRSLFEEAKDLVLRGYERFLDLGLSAGEWQELARWYVLEAGPVEAAQREILWRSVENAAQGSLAPEVHRAVLESLVRGELVDLERIVDEANRVEGVAGDGVAAESGPEPELEGILGADARTLERIWERLLRTRASSLRRQLVGLSGKAGALEALGRKLSSSARADLLSLFGAESATGAAFPVATDPEALDAGLFAARLQALLEARPGRTESVPSRGSASRSLLRGPEIADSEMPSRLLQGGLSEERPEAAAGAVPDSARDLLRRRDPGLFARDLAFEVWQGLAGEALAAGLLPCGVRDVAILSHLLPHFEEPVAFLHGVLAAVPGFPAVSGNRGTLLDALRTAVDPDRGVLSEALRRQVREAPADLAWVCGMLWGQDTDPGLLGQFLSWLRFERERSRGLPSRRRNLLAPESHSSQAERASVQAPDPAFPKLVETESMGSVAAARVESGRVGEIPGVGDRSGSTAPHSLPVSEEAGLTRLPSPEGAAFGSTLQFEALARQAWNEADPDLLLALGERILHAPELLRSLVSHDDQFPLLRRIATAVPVPFLADLLAVLSVSAADLFLRLESLPVDSFSSENAPVQPLRWRSLVFAVLLDTLRTGPAWTERERIGAVAMAACADGIPTTAGRILAALDWSDRELDGLLEPDGTDEGTVPGPQEILELLEAPHSPDARQRRRMAQGIQAASTRDLVRMRGQILSSSDLPARLVERLPASSCEALVLAGRERAAEGIEVSRHVVQALSLFVPDESPDLLTSLGAQRWIYLLGADLTDAASLADLPSRLVSWLGRTCGIQNARAARRAVERRLALRMPELPVRKAPEAVQSVDAVAEGLRVGDAGLVLLAPYLPRLFDMLGLIEDGRLREGGLGKAVALLQHLAGIEDEIPDHLLLLDKLLCGIPMAATVDREAILLPEEKETCRQMLMAIISHWSVLGSTSPEGLQQTFLRRDGLLRRGENDWHLKVEGSAFDVLLDRIPWSFATVKFAWMEKPLHVEWR